ISDLAAKSGLSTEQTQKGLGAVLSFVKESLPAETFNQVSAAVPGSDEMMAAADVPKEEHSGGLIETIKEMASKLFGGGGSATLITRLSGLGISPEQAQSFLPQVMEFLRERLPESVTQQLSGLLPTPQETHA